MSVPIPPVSQPGPEPGRTAEALLAEYTALRAEILSRVQQQLVVLGGAVALAAGIGPASTHLDDQHAPTALLLMPLVFAVVSLLYLEQDAFLTDVARYLHNVVRPAYQQLAATTDVPLVFQWEAVRRRLLFTVSGAAGPLHPAYRPKRGLWFVMAWRAAATIGPGIASIYVVVARLVTRPNFRRLFDWDEYGLLVAGVLVVAVVLVRFYKTVDAYRSITEPYDEAL